MNKEWKESTPDEIVNDMQSFIDDYLNYNTPSIKIKPEYLGITTYKILKDAGYIQE